MVGGQFTSFGDQPRNRIARLVNDTAATSTLVVTPNSVIWTRGGSAPELTRATFEILTIGGTTYTFLGDATRIGTTSNFQLTGLNLPTGQTLLIRARGFYSSGYQNGSGSIVEQVEKTRLKRFHP